MSKINQFKDFGIRYKDALAKGDYNTVSAFNRQLNEIRGLFEESKMASKGDDHVWQAKMAGKWNPTDNDVSLANANSYSVLDSRHHTLDPNRLSLNRTPLDLNKWLTGNQSNFKRGTQPSKADTFDDKQGLRTTYSHDVYGSDAIRGMADIANLNVENAGKESSEYDAFEGMQHNPTLAPQLQAAYASVYGRDAVMDTPGKTAAAYSILHNSIPTNEKTETKPFESPETKWGFEKRKMNYQQGLTQANERYKKWLDEGGTGVVNSRLNSIIDASKNSPVPMTVNGNPLTSYNITPTPGS